jgi:hypothetical protein
MYFGCKAIYQFPKIKEKDFHPSRRSLKNRNVPKISSTNALAKEIGFSLAMNTSRAR